jgi:hypothetical protein
METLWNLIEASWKIEPEERITAGQVVASLKALPDWNPRLAAGLHTSDALLNFQDASKLEHSKQNCKDQTKLTLKVHDDHVQTTQSSPDSQPNPSDTAISARTPISCYPSAMDLLLSSFRFQEPYKPPAFTTKQLSAAQAILQYLRDHPNSGLPPNLITPELARMKDGRGWCLIGDCRSEWAKQKSSSPYGPPKDVSSSKTMDQICDHIHHTHFNLRSF